MLSKLVHIVLSDEGWILERLAKEICSRVPAVDYSLSPDPLAPVQYYITYGCRNRRISPIEIGLFTHREAIPAAAKRFNDVALQVDARIAMCEATARLLPNAPNVATEVICPGVDLERFVPRLRIGVVGRTYATGRKGEDLVAAVQDIPGIEWCFTGKGWPGESAYVPEADLPAFYRSLDYVLVPARIEGGPMCVIEALACGIEVIAPPVGWVPNLPHIEFETGNAESLRAVLLSLIARRQALRSSVIHQTWDAWAAKHDELFNRLAPKKTQVPSAGIPPPIKAVIAVHGEEVSGSLGGPSIRGPLTAELLAQEGVQARFHQDRTFATSDFDLVHVMNVWEPSECGLVIDQARKSDKPVVLSPIFLDLAEHNAYSRIVPEILEKSKNPSVVNAAFAALRKQISVLRQRPAKQNDVVPGYGKAVRELVAKSDNIICLSQDEADNLASIGVAPKSCSIVKNCLTSDIFFNGDPSIFENEYGIKDYVLVTGRLEPRKNQATLAYALRDAPFPLVFLGHCENEAYFQTLKIAAGPNAHFIGRIEPCSEMLASAFAGARVFCLPSWAEGAPLAAIEAAAAGCTMVLSDRSAEREYFGDLAYYCDPANPEQMAALVTRTYAEGRTEERAAALQTLVRTELSQEKYAAETRKAYDVALANAAPQAPDQTGYMVIDLTTLAHRDGPPSGIARAEDRFAMELERQFPDRVRYVVWNSHFQKFLRVSVEAFQSGEVKLFRGADAAEYIRHPNAWLPFEEVDFKPTDRLVIFGGAWIRNPFYIRDLKALKKAFNIPIISTVYDVIQWKFSELFPSGVGEEFTSNCKAIIEISDRVLTCSKCSERDIIEFGMQYKTALPPIDVFRLGDELDSIDPTAELQIDRIGDLGGENRFVLYVSAIDVRKNHRLLVEVWSRLIDSYGAKAPKLVLVGSKGWGSDPIMAAAKSPKLRQFIHWMHEINDVTLEWLYINCEFTVYPSLYEGWGLPIAESLQYGKFCLASNGGSILEIAPGFVETLDPMDFMGWFAAIERYIRFPALVQQKEAAIANYRRVTWAEAAAGVADRISKATPHRQLPLLEVGTNYHFSCASLPHEVQAVEDFVVGGISDLEKDGAWTVGTAAAMVFRLQDERPAVLALTATPLISQTKPSITLALSLNDVRFNRSLTRSAQTVFLPLPRVGREAKDFTLRVDVLDPVAPKDLYDDSTDNRLLGVKIHNIAAIHCISPDHDKWEDSLANEPLSQALIRLPKSQDEICVILEVSGLADADISLIRDGTLLQATKLRKGRKQWILAVVRSDTDLFSGSSLIHIVSEAEVPFLVLRTGVFSSIPEDVLLASVEQPQNVMGTRSEPNWFGSPLSLCPENGKALTPDQTVLDAVAGGWSTLPDDRLWSNGGESSIYFTPPSIDRDTALTLHIEVSPYRWAMMNDELNLFVKIDNAEPRRLFIRGLRIQMLDVHFELPAGRADQDPVRVTFWSDRTMVPSLLGQSADQRSLSFAVHHMRLSQPAKLTVPAESMVAIQDEHAAALSGCWHQVESEGVWMTEGRNTVSMAYMGGTEPVDTLTLEYQVFEGLLLRGPATFSVWLNGTCLGGITEDREGRRTAVLPIPAGSAIKGTGEGLLTLEIDAPEGISPHFASGAVDERVLSVKLIRLALGTIANDDAEVSADGGDDQSLNEEVNRPGSMETPTHEKSSYHEQDDEQVFARGRERAVRIVPDQEGDL